MSEAKSRGLSWVQTVGQKGLKQVCVERRVYRVGMHQPQLLEALQQFDDFSPKKAHERAKVTEICQKHSSIIAFFGVKYHAEFQPIERKVDAPQAADSPVSKWQAGSTDEVTRKSMVQVHCS